MNHARRTFAFSSLLAVALVLGAAESAMGASTYPPSPGSNSGLPSVPAPVFRAIAPLIAGELVEIARAPESKVVYTIRVESPTRGNLANLSTQARPNAVQVTQGLIMGGITRSSAEPKMTVNVKSNAPVEMQTNDNVPTSISLSGYKPGQKVTITAIQGGKSVVVGTFTVGSSGILILPAVTMTGHSSVEFSMKSSSGTKSLVLRPVTSKSKFSTATVRVAKK